MQKSIVLIGFMGCGKSTIGVALAKELGRKFIDTDSYIEYRERMSIPKIFRKHGEAYFRALETKHIAAISENLGVVVATGGGAVKSHVNIENLKKTGIIVYLQATPEHIYKNVENSSRRPLLQVDDKLSRIKELMAEREPLYIANSDVTVDITNLEKMQSVEKILNELNITYRKEI